MKKLYDMTIALSSLIAFALVFFGASNLLNDNPRGFIEVGLAFVIAVPVVILANREERR